MINLRIQGEAKVEKSTFEGTLYLEQRGDGDVDLIILDTKGNDWYIVQLKTDGTIERHWGLPDCIGLQVDKNGRIELSEEE